MPCFWQVSKAFQKIAKLHWNFVYVWASNNVPLSCFCLVMRNIAEFALLCVCPASSAKDPIKTTGGCCCSRLKHSEKAFWKSCSLHHENCVTNWDEIFIISIGTSLMWHSCYWHCSVDDWIDPNDRSKVRKKPWSLCEWHEKKMRSHLNFYV